MAPQTEILPPTMLQGPGPRRSDRLAPTTTPLLPPPRTKRQKRDDLINVRLPVCSVIIVGHDKTLKVMQSTSSTQPPSLPADVRVEATYPRETGKGRGRGKEVGTVQGGGDNEDGDDEHNGQAVDDPSYKDNHDLSAQLFVQHAS